LIADGSRWGIWIIEFLSLSGAAVIGFLVLRGGFGNSSALLGSVVWLGSLPWVLEGGNLTEEFALPFQFGLLYLFWRAEDLHDYARRGIGIGIAAGLCLMLRQNLVGLSISIVLYLVLMRGFTVHWLLMLRQLATMFLGLVLVLGSVGLWFGAHGALKPAWNAAFSYNFVYIESTLALRDRLAALMEGVRLLVPSGISIAAIGGWFIACLSLAKDRRNVKPLVVLAIIALPVEFLLSSLSGESYPHYFIAWLPTFAVLSSFFARSVEDWCLALQSRMNIVRVHKYCISFVLLFEVMLLLFRSSADIIYTLGPAVDDSLEVQAVKYVRRNTKPGDYVLMWGAETAINFLSDRRSPTRFVYQYPLYRLCYVDGAMVEEFLIDIKNNEPAVIIDTSGTNPKIAPLDPDERIEWLDSHGILPGMVKVFEYLDTHYSYASSIVHESSCWSVYVLDTRAGQ
jgi:hypothetical protein